MIERKYLLATAVCMGLAPVGCTATGAAPEPHTATPNAPAATPSHTATAAPSAGSQAYQLLNANSGLALDGSDVPVQAAPSANPAQQWFFNQNLDGSYQLMNVARGLCLNIPEQPQAPGAHADQVPCQNIAPQDWNLLPQKDGTYALQNVDSALLLEVAGAQTSAGAAIQQWVRLNQSQQAWHLQAVDAQGSPTAAAAPRASTDSPGRLLFGYDPSMLFFNGKYYLVQADFDQRVSVLRSSDLAQVANDEVFTYVNTADVPFNSEAPDIAVVTDPRDGQQKLAVYVTKTYPFPGSVKVLLTADPAQGFEDLGFVDKVSGYDAHFMAHPNGQQYLIYSNFSSLLIIQMATPWTSQGDPVVISNATLPWETQQGALNEAPAHVISGNTVNLVYSANSYNDPRYLCGLITANVQADPMDPSSWTKHAEGPAFAASNGHYGTGSGTLFGDGNTTWWAFDSFADPNVFNSEIRAQPVTFDAQGVLQLGAAK